jgi:diguanylate cyclase (GGDEF)-like protein
MLSHIGRIADFIGHARARSLLVAGGSCIGAGLAAIMIWFMVFSHQAVLDDALREMRNDALLLAEQEDHLLQSVDLVQLALIEHMRVLGIDSTEKFERLMASPDVRRDLKDRVAGLSYIAVLSLAEPNGRLATYTRNWPPPAVIDTDRDLSNELAGPGAPQTFISVPSRSQTTGQWTIYLSRRFDTADGQLIGYAVSTITMDYFEQFYAQLPLTGRSSYALYRSDGVLMARYPNVDSKIGKTFFGTMNFNRLRNSADGGFFQARSTLDGKERLIVAHTLEHFPLIIAVTDTTASVLGYWSQEAWVFGTTTGLLELVLAITTMLSVRHLRSYESLQAAEAARARAEAELTVLEERERAGQTLHVQEQRFDTALQNMLQGLLMISHSGQLLVANRRMHDLVGLPPGTLTPGMNYREVQDCIVARGNVSADDMRSLVTRRMALLDHGQRAVVTWELSDGRAFNVTHLPMAEGWLATYEDIGDRRRAEARMVYLAHHDALTELPNRLLFRAKLNDALAYARRGDLLALLCLDLDQFKAVNDTLGHPVGDLLLRAVAERLLHQTRDTDTVARLGGDEFAIVMAPLDKPTEAIQLAGRLVELMAPPFEVSGHQIVIGTSIGIAFAPQDGLDADTLLRCADLALYRAKVDGRGVYRLFHAEMDAQMQKRRLLELDLRQALSAGQFEVFYQPVIDLHARAVTSVEALVRWRHPERGLVSPADFIPLAEEIGLIVPLGEWVLRTACATVASWPGALCVAVNLSPAQFRTRNLVSTVTQALNEANLSPDRLELEITETVMLQDTDSTLATLHRLHDLGVRIAMDDFGTGYSSLSYLRRFPFDRIKIDQSFVRDLSRRPDCGAIIRAVAGLSHELGMATTAEGVETREQLDLVTRAGCAEIQGYLFSPAVPADAFAGTLASIDAVLLEDLAPEPVV